MMRKRLIYALFVIGLAMPVLTFSAQPGNQLGSCMVDALNGAERKQLAKWIFFSMAAHPEIHAYLQAAPETIEETDQAIGALITRLLVDDCPDELVAANRANPLAVQQAFELVGKVAVQELMTDQSVMQAISNYSNYADFTAINQLLLGE